MIAMLPPSRQPGRANWERIKSSFLIKKLGLSDSPALMDGIHAAIETYGKSERSKFRAVFYYLLVKHFGARSGLREEADSAAHLNGMRGTCRLRNWPAQVMTTAMARMARIFRRVWSTRVWKGGLRPVRAPRFPSEQHQHPAGDGAADGGITAIDQR